MLQVPWLLGSRSSPQGCRGAVGQQQGHNQLGVPSPVPSALAWPGSRMAAAPSHPTPAVSGMAGASWAGGGTSASGKVYSFPVHLEMTLIKKTDLD